MVDAIAAGAASSLSESDGDIWKRLWKLYVVPKVRVFLGGEFLEFLYLITGLSHEGMSSKIAPMDYAR
jgi:hypothetical protein